MDAARVWCENKRLFYFFPFPKHFFSLFDDRINRRILTLRGDACANERTDSWGERRYTTEGFNGFLEFHIPYLQPFPDSLMISVNTQHPTVPFRLRIKIRFMKSSLRHLRRNRKNFCIGEKRKKNIPLIMNSRLKTGTHGKTFRAVLKN